MPSFLGKEPKYWKHHCNISVKAKLSLDIIFVFPNNCNLAVLTALTPLTEDCERR
jgi:hypothetical protein